MSALKDKFLWSSYGKFALVATVGFALSTLVGVPASTAVTLAAGAVLSFPAAYGIIRKSEPEQSAPPGSRASAL